MRVHQTARHFVLAQEFYHIAREENMSKEILDLLELRKDLDKIDREIVRLYLERMEICDRVGQHKVKTGKKVFDPKREQEKLESVSKNVIGDFNQKGIREIFTQLMSLSRKLQYQRLGLEDDEKTTFKEIEALKNKNTLVAFQGVVGSYGQEAMHQYFGEDCDSISLPTFREAINAIKDERATYAVLPIENSAMGAVREVYDLLVECDCFIVGEQIIPINHVLAGLPEASIEDIEKVYSKAEALMQTSKYLNKNTNWQQISVSNTAIAASEVAFAKDPSKVAVCSAYAAKIYGLKILADEINDEVNNSTRFIVISKDKVYLKNANKISICFEVANESGSLYHLLSHFIYNNLNMTKIESRPIDGRPWEYRFFVDFEGSIADVGVRNALRGLKEEAKSLKVLGARYTS